MAKSKRDPSKSVEYHRQFANALFPMLSLDELVIYARAAVEELRSRGAVLGIEGDSAHHHDALRSIESLATRAHAAESLATAPSNEGGR